MSVEALCLEYYELLTKEERSHGVNIQSCMSDYIILGTENDLSIYIETSYREGNGVMHFI